MKKIFVLFVSCVLAGSAFAAPAKKSTKAQAKAPAKVEFVIVESDEYNAGKEDAQLTAGIASFLGGEPVVTKLSYKEALADSKLANMDYSFLPLYLVKKTDDIRTKLERHIQAGYAIETADFIALPRQTREGVHNGKEAKPNVMEIFVMSQCPYGVMAENAVLKAKNEGKLPSDKEIKIRYIVNYSANNGFSSLHGSAEWEENIRQLLVAKYYPEKFWKYLEIRNKDYKSSRWDKALEEAGINAKKIMKKFDTEGIELLKAEAEYTKAYSIGASPSFLWEGKVLLNFGSAAKIEGFEFLDPKASNPNAAPVPAGSC